jgi:hypothetical protein
LRCVNVHVAAANLAFAQRQRISRPQVLIIDDGCIRKHIPEHVVRDVRDTMRKVRRVPSRFLGLQRSSSRKYALLLHDIATHVGRKRRSAPSEFVRPSHGLLQAWSPELCEKAGAGSELGSHVRSVLPASSLPRIDKLLCLHISGMLRRISAWLAPRQVRMELSALLLDVHQRSV